MDEFSLIERFFRSRMKARGDVRLGIGDDAAVVAAEGELAVSTDVLVAGVHFPNDTPAASVGHKSLAVNLSDMAAMGASPAWATLGLTLPNVDESWLQEFCEGFFALAETFEVELVGGDMTQGPLAISVNVIGKVAKAGYLSRDGARDGDLIYVSGTLGDAALGLRSAGGLLTAPPVDLDYFRERLDRPSPRVDLGIALTSLATAGIDVSDGLVSDLGHICHSSRVGAEVDVDRIPVSEAYRRCLSTVGLDPALSFGDDYELCFTVPRERQGDIDRLSRKLDLDLTPVGRIGGHDMTWLYEGRPYSFDGQGYRHFE